ncbi:MAG TPA: hypothetical protein VM266_06110 [Solirubrobacteraceae bacterium]|nr:hypothetical protein [Solirubrobacteraceae bacterium]
MREHVQERSEQPAAPAPAALSAAPLAPASPAGLLSLQRRAGNRAAAALARTAVPSPQPTGEPTQEEMTAAVEATRTGPSTVVRSSGCTNWCFAPLPLAGPVYAGAWGMLAHAFISLDYESVMGVSRGGDVYFDNSFAGAIDPGYGAFIHRKNPGNVIAPVFFAITPVKRPDALLHDASRTEFDEFKPDSIAGRLDGRLKLAQIDGYMGLLGLPYHRGTSYVPTPSIPILTTSLRGVPIELSLSVRRDAPGLIVYEYCICTDWALLSKAAVIALILLLIALILRGRIPMPSPSPVPIPIPA